MPAGLRLLRCVNAVQPDALLVDNQCVAVYNSGRALDHGVGVGWAGCEVAREGAGKVGQPAFLGMEDCLCCVLEPLPEMGEKARKTAAAIAVSAVVGVRCLQPCQ